MRALFAAALWLFGVFAADLAHGQESASEQAFGATINGVSTDLVVFGLVEPSGVFLRTEEFEAIGLVRPDVSPLARRGRTYLPLLAVPGLRYDIDERRLELLIQCLADCFPSQIIGGASSRPILSPTAPGFSIDYDLNIERYGGRYGGGGVAELGVFTDQGLGQVSFLAEGADGQTSVRRLQTAWRIDQPKALRVFRLGDAVTEPGAWGAPVRFGGLQIASDLSMDPNFIPFVTPSVVGAATLPSVLDIFVDNTLRASQDIRPGPFSIVDLPVVTGQGQVRVVARDVLGREQIILAPFYVSRRQLKPGLALYSFEAGALRHDYGQAGDGYGAAFASGVYRVGLSRRLTGELKATATRGYAAAGAAASVRTWAPGSLEFTGAFSRTPQGQGSLVRIGYSIVRGRWSVGVADERATREFRQLGQAPTFRTPARTLRANLGAGFDSWGSLSVGYVGMQARGEPWAETVTATYARNLGALGQFNLSGLRDRASGRTDVMITLTRSLGARRDASLAVRTAGSGGSRVEAIVSQNAPPQGGWGGRLVATGSEDSRLSVWRDGAYGFAEIDLAQSAARLWASGRFAYIQGAVAPARRDSGAMALVEVPGYGGVGVLRDNKRVGVTDASGKAFITGLRPYQENIIAIDALDLPAGVDLTKTYLSIVPRMGSAARARFEVHGRQGLLVVVRLADGLFPPPGSQVVAVDTGEAFTVGYDGQVYLTGLGAERRFKLLREEGLCEFQVQPSAGSSAPPPVISCRGP